MLWYFFRAKAKSLILKIFLFSFFKVWFPVLYFNLSVIIKIKNKLNNFPSLPPPLPYLKIDDQQLVGPTVQIKASRSNICGHQNVKATALKALQRLLSLLLWTIAPRKKIKIFFQKFIFKNFFKFYLNFPSLPIRRNCLVPLQGQLQRQPIGNATGIAKNHLKRET